MRKPPQCPEHGRTGSTRALVLTRSHPRRPSTRILCRFSLDPDSLIRHDKERFAAHRVRYLIVAKFLPSVNLLAAGVAA